MIADSHQALFRYVFFALVCTSFDIVNADDVTVRKNDIALLYLSKSVERLETQIRSNEHYGLKEKIESVKEKRDKILQVELTNRLMEEFQRLNSRIEKFGDPIQLLLKNFPDPLTGNSLSSALWVYDELTKHYPNADETTSIEKSLVKKIFDLALSQRDPWETERLYQVIIDKFPDSPLAAQSKINKDKVIKRSKNRYVWMFIIAAFLFLLPFFGLWHGEHINDKNPVRMNLVQTSCAHYFLFTNRFEREGAGGSVKFLVTFFSGFVGIPISFILTILYIPAFLVMRSVHWVWLGYRGVRYQCPYPDDGIRFRLPIHVCSCGTRYDDLRPGIYGLLYHTCRHENHKGNHQKLPTLDMLGRGNEEKSGLKRLCGNCKRPLIHRSGLEMPVYPVALFGAPNSGKTVYLHQTIEELLSKWNKGRNECYIDSPEDKGKHKTIIERLKKGGVPAKTRAVQNAIGMALMIPEWRLRALIHFYDSAGERYEDLEQFRDMGVVQFLRCAFLLIDPFSLPNSKILLGKEADQKAEIVVNHLLTAVIPMRNDNPLAMDAIPIAVILTRCDELPGEKYPEFKNLNSNPPSSEDCKRIFEKLGGTSLIRLLESNFKNIEFFAVSALGRPPNTGSGPFVPQGVIHPLRYLLSHKQLKKRWWFA